MDKIIDSMTDTYKSHNEDIYGMTDHSYWILDGALALNKSKFTHEFSDVVWMVKWWQKYLKGHIDQFEKTIINILEEGMEQLNLEFSEFVSISDLSKLDRASAGIAIVRINGNIIESFVLGDVEINISKYNGEIITLVDNKIEELDDIVMNMIFNNMNRDQEIAFNAYTQEELEVLKKHRLKMNAEEDGYSILEHDVKAIKNGIYKEYKYQEVKEILMMSDGFSSIYTKFNQLDIKELLEVSRRKGLKEVLKMIRDIENADPNMTTFKRLRKHDDATAIYIR